MKNIAKLLMPAVIAVIISCGCSTRYPTKVQQEQLNKYLSYWNTGNMDGIEKVLSADYEYIASPKYEPEKGIEAFKKSISEMRTSYPDFKVAVIEKLANKDGVAIIWKITCSPAGNSSVKLEGKGISVIHFKDGKIKDEWLANNNLLWLRQLGYSITLPPTTPAPEKKSK